jgi:acyl-CoA hydrolase
MELKGSKTEAKLLSAFTWELHAKARYEYFAAAAREAGLEQVADIFWATAQNEAEHARHEFEFLGGAGETKANLVLAVAREHEEATKLYPEAADTAKEEGFTEVSDFFRRMGQVEGRHEKNFHEILETLDKGGAFRGQTVGHSAIEMAQVMLPDQANPAGFAHGGELMKLMDNCAGVVAARHCRTNIVTATVEDIRFQNMVRVGDLAIFRGKITFTSRSSMEVRIDVEAEDLLSGQKRPAVTAHFVMVALGADGRPVEVPPLILSTEEEQKLFNEGQARYESRRTPSRKQPD